MRDIIVFVWRLFQRLQLSHNKVSIHRTAKFNKKTSFAGNNKIYENVVVGGAKIGRFTSISRSSSLPHALIGSFTSIGQNVKVEVFSHPSRGFISTCSVFYNPVGECGESFTNKKYFDSIKRIGEYSCIIGNDVWIGSNVLIMGGVTIGDGAIIGMGAVVTKDIPPYGVAVGVPATVIRFRYPEEKISQLLKLNWWYKDKEWIKKNSQLFIDEEQFFNNIKEVDYE